jgi:hypothetical protein
MINIPKFSLPFLMKHYLSLFMLFAIAPLWAQGDTEVYWAELSITENSMTLGPLTNLSQNPGYENQSSFWSEEVLIYTATSKLTF